MAATKKRRRLTTGKVAIGRAEKMRSVFELRKAGWYQRAIAEHLGISVGSVNELLKAGIKEHPVEAIEDYRALRMAELDAQRLRHNEIIGAHIDNAKAGRFRAGTAVRDHELVLLRVNAQRDVLMGANAPVKSEVTIDGSIETTAHDDVVGALTALLAKGGVGGGDPPPDAGSGD